jgi:hypothetical protein
MSNGTASPVVGEAQVKRRKVIDDSCNTRNSSKKPPMKYDPDEPMSKEEAASWRREQRRKRNRESAAASRQRQRDRIVELEVEVDEWKANYDEIMAKIKELEAIVAKKQNQETPQASQSIVTDESMSKFVSPPSSPGHSPFPAAETSPVSSSLVNAVKLVSIEGIVNQILEEEEEQQYSDNMISRQAVS